MKTTSRIFSIILSSALIGAVFTNCGSHSDKTDGKGDPVLTHETPVYDETTGTFSLTVKADSVNGATLLYSLMLGDSILSENAEGQFTGIFPFEEGYDVKLQAQWPDTTIERYCHVMDFVVPMAPVEKISLEDLAKLINNKDESLSTGTNGHIAQGVTFKAIDSKMQPQMLPDAIALIQTGVWKGVEIVKLEYNDKNLVTDITLRPVGEEADVIDEDDEDLDY